MRVSNRCHCRHPEQGLKGHDHTPFIIDLCTNDRVVFRTYRKYPQLLNLHNQVRGAIHPSILPLVDSVVVLPHLISSWHRCSSCATASSSRASQSASGCTLAASSAPSSPIPRTPNNAGTYDTSHLSLLRHVIVVARTRVDGRSGAHGVEPHWQSISTMCSATPRTIPKVETSYVLLAAPSLARLSWRHRANSPI